MIKAIQYGFYDIVDYLLCNNYFDVNFEPKYEYFCCASLLMCAISNTHIDIVELLLSHPKIDINKCCSRCGTRPLHFAIAGCSGEDQFYSEEIVELLIEKGADITQTTSYGDTILHIACWENRQALLIKLFNLPRIGEIINIKNGGNEGPLDTQEFMDFSNDLFSDDRDKICRLYNCLAGTTIIRNIFNKHRKRYVINKLLNKIYAPDCIRNKMICKELV